MQYYVFMLNLPESIVIMDYQIQLQVVADVVVVLASVVVLLLRHNIVQSDGDEFDGRVY